MNDDNALSVERARWLRRQIARPRVVFAILAVVVLNVIASVTKAARALSIAAAGGISSEQALALLHMKTTIQLGRTFTGHEVVFIEYATSAFAYFCTSSLLMLLFGLYRAGMHRQAKVWRYIDELETRARPNHETPRD
jgi:hypothetical protein